jgi:hypothetical protein
MKHIFWGIIGLMLLGPSANAALHSRLAGQAYYDTMLDITWLADANLADTNAFGVTGINANGTMTWAKANEWIAAMNTAIYLGKTDWRLPTVEPVNGASFNYSFANNGSTDYAFNISAPGSVYSGSMASEMPHLFYVTLGNTGAVTNSGLSTGCASAPPVYCLTNDGPFANISAVSVYFSGTAYGAAVGNVWAFGFGTGDQGPVLEGSSRYAWAVRDGDIGEAPVPAAIWLFGGALGVLGVVRRRARA